MKTPNADSTRTAEPPIVFETTWTYEVVEDDEGTMHKILVPDIRSSLIPVDVRTRVTVEVLPEGPTANSTEGK